jgi:hypothetical protein
VTRSQTFRFFLATNVVLLIVLLLDRPGLAAQAALGLSVAALLVVHVRPHRQLWLEVILAILIATTGEIVLSIGLGIYGYRSGGIPLYVPPGHGVMYLLAVQSALHLKRFEKPMIIATVVAGTTAAVAMTVFFHDWSGMLAWTALMVIGWKTQRGLLIATCVALTSVLEIAGTLLGTWEWHERILGGLSQGNPPIGVGLLYCCLDLLTIAALNGLASRRQNAVCTSAMFVATSSPLTEDQAA